MSSIIVRGMDKPESCGKCFFRDGIFCEAKNYKRISYVALDGKIEIWCPLIEVPPHGDLVDRTELLAEYDRQHKGPAGGARRIMEQATAVIEAEGSEK